MEIILKEFIAQNVYIDCQLDWRNHVKKIANKIAKNVSIINRVKHLLNSNGYILCTALSSCLILISVVKCGEIHIRTKCNVFT